MKQMPVKRKTDEERQALIKKETDAGQKLSVKKGDILILVLALAIAGILMLAGRQQPGGDRISITVNGDETLYSLETDRVIPLDSENGHNQVVIKDHTVYMESANCPDQICVRHKAVSKNGETIICLPNQVFIEVESSKEKDIDN